MSTKIRSSSQLYIDSDLQHNGKKGVGLAAGTTAGDAVEFSQLNTAINNAVAGAGNSIHEPVQDLVAAKAVPNADLSANGVVTMGGKTDKMIMLVENLGLYRYDAESTVASNDGTVIRPTDVATDAAAGRWLKMSSILTDHSLLNGLQGDGEVHLSATQRQKLIDAMAGADITNATNVGAAIGGTAADVSLADTDAVAIVAGSVLGKTTFAIIRDYFKATYDNIYEKVANKNATGGYAGLTGFSINLKNAAGTITALLTTIATTAKIYTLPDRTMTVAGTDDVATAQAAAIAACPAETAQTIGTIVANSTLKTPADLDWIPMSDVTATNIIKKFTWASLYGIIFGKVSGDITVSAAGVATIGNDKVTTVKILDGNITANKLGADSVTTVKILDANVTTGKIADNAVTTAKILDANVTANKLSTDSVTAVKIAADAVTTVKILNGNVTTAKIADNAVDNVKLADMATGTIKARLSAGTGDPEDVTLVALRTALGVAWTRYYRVTPPQVPNGSIFDFVIPATIIAGTEEVFLNGLMMNAGGNDYTLVPATPAAGQTTIRFVAAPTGTPFIDTILVNYNA